MFLLEITYQIANVVGKIIIYIFNFVSSVAHTRHKLPPIDNPIVLESAVALAKLIRERKLTSRKVVEAFIGRSRQVNWAINAIVDDRYEEALIQADKVDQDIADGTITEADFDEKHFLGVPFTCKETIHNEGMNITFGVVERIGLKADEDADVVKNVKKTGAILIGVTNVPSLNKWYETWNQVYGRTNNPYDTRRNAGGSSGGEAAMLAACAGDIGGSIRIPAFMCGVFGHKMSHGFTPLKGFGFASGAGKETTMCVCGPIVKNSEDLIPLLKAIIGPELEVLNLDESVDITKLNFFYMLELTNRKVTPTDSETKDSLLRVVDYFRSKGNQIERINEIKEFKEASKLFHYWVSLEHDSDFAYNITGRTRRANVFAEFFKKILGRSNLTWCSIIVLYTLMTTKFSEEQVLSSTASIKKYLLDKLSNNGILLFPTYMCAAPYHYRTILTPYNFLYSAIFNVLKFPATQVPLGLNQEGIPLGIQVVAAPMQDRLCIAVAKELEKAFGGYVKPS